jgi:hypothetical protein
MQQINETTVIPEVINILWAALDREVVIPPVVAVGDEEYDLIQDGELDFDGLYTRY